jgi:ABC-2 type transport system permease protein
MQYAVCMPAEIVWLTAQQLLTRAKIIILGGVAALPPLLAVLYAVSGADVEPERFLRGLCDGLVLTTVLPVVALVLGGAALGNEAEDGTIIYLVMKPVPRWGIVAAKYLATLVIVAAILVISVLVTTVITGRDATTLRVGWAFAAACVAGAVGYTAAFLFLGLVTSRTLVIGLLYVFLWEGALTGLFPGLRNLSVREYSRAVAEAIANVSTSLINARISTTSALIGMAIVTIACLIITTRRLEVMDVE